MTQEQFEQTFRVIGLIAGTSLAAILVKSARRPGAGRWGVTQTQGPPTMTQTQDLDALIAEMQCRREYYQHWLYYSRLRDDLVRVRAENERLKTIICCAALNPTGDK